MERRRRRAISRKVEQKRGEEKGCGIAHPAAELRGHAGGDFGRRSSGSTAARSFRAPMAEEAAARLGFARARWRQLRKELEGGSAVLLIVPFGDPWRAGQGAARGGVWRPDSLSPRRPRGGRRPQQAGPACRRQRGGGADLGREMKVGRWKGGVWAAGEEKEREREVGWAGWAENKGRKKKRLCIFETKSNNSIQTQIQRIQI